MNMPPDLYDTADPAAAQARKRDDEWFAQHPRQTWRVRPLLEGECPLAERLRAAGAGFRAYAIVIDHARAGDMRARIGRGVYPLVIREADRDAMLRLLNQEGERWARWFRKSSCTPPPARPGHGIVI